MLCHFQTLYRVPGEREASEQPGQGLETLLLKCSYSSNNLLSLWLFLLAKLLSLETSTGFFHAQEFKPRRAPHPDPQMPLTTKTPKGAVSSLVNTAKFLSVNNFLCSLPQSTEASGSLGWPQVLYSQRSATPRRGPGHIQSIPSFVPTSLFACFKLDASRTPFSFCFLLPTSI